MPTEDANAKPIPGARREHGAERASRASSVQVPAPAPSPLRELLDYVEATRDTISPVATAAATNDTWQTSASPSSVLDEFQQLWGRIRTDSQLRQSLAAVPEDAGPLHSSALLHRAITLMQDVAPGYLQHFIAYVDALSWMEQLRVSGALDAGGDAGGSARKPAAKPRSRKRS